MRDVGRCTRVRMLSFEHVRRQTLPCSAEAIIPYVYKVLFRASTLELEMTSNRKLQVADSIAIKPKT